MAKSYLPRTSFASRTLFVNEHCSKDRSACEAARIDGAYPWRRLALVAVLAAEIMDLVDGTIVGIAAPSIRTELGGGLD